jgi:hypothetical protein
MNSETMKRFIPMLLCTLVSTYVFPVQAQALDARKNESLLPNSLDLWRIVDTSSRIFQGNGEQDKLLGKNRLHGLGNDFLIADKGDSRSAVDTQLDPQHEILAKGVVALYFNGQFRTQLDMILDQQGYAIDRVFDDPNTSFQALGLRSKDGMKPPVLVFAGGFTSSNSADVGDTAALADPKGYGSSQFFANKQAIQAWLITITHDQQLNPQGFKPNITGTSLGGALTQWVASEFPTFISSAASFQSPGITRDAAQKFIENGGAPYQVRHYIVDGDVTSLEGESFIPGKVVVSTFEANEADRANYFERKHQSGILVDLQPFQSLFSRNTDPSITQFFFLTSKPANQNLSEISVDELSQPNFTFQGKDWQIGLEIARANDPNFVVNRQNVEALRRSDFNALLKIFRISQ